MARKKKKKTVPVPDNYVNPKDDPDNYDENGKWADDSGSSPKADDSISPPCFQFFNSILLNDLELYGSV